MKIDHLEIFVPNRELAAAWYAQVFGFQIAQHLRDWAISPSGPLMISAGNDEMIALFEGKSQEDHTVRGLRRLAFRASGQEFLDFIATSPQWSNPPLNIGDVKDHSRAYSIYFTDPYGNPLEVTTYDIEVVAEYLKSIDDGAETAG